MQVQYYRQRVKTAVMVPNWSHPTLLGLLNQLESTLSEPASYTHKNFTGYYRVVGALNSTVNMIEQDWSTATIPLSKNPLIMSHYSRPTQSMKIMMIGKPINTCIYSM